MIRRFFTLHRAEEKSSLRYKLCFILYALCFMFLVSSLSVLAEAEVETETETQTESEETTEQVEKEPEPPFEKDDLYEQIELFSTAMVYVLRNYYNDNEEFSKADVEKLMNGAISGMLQGLGDRYSVYLPETYKKREQENLFHAKFGGLGIRILPSADGFVKIVQPLDGTPAMKAGLRSGDKIISVEGESIENKPLSDVVDVLRGEVGTDVTITIYRPGRNMPFDVTVTRGIITNPSMSTIMMDGGIGYVALSRFTKETPREVEQALEDLKAEGMKALILDLRGNTGGLMSSAVAVADAFLEGGVIVSTEGRIERSNSEHRATAKTLCPMDMPLAILINGHSASGSEIVAGAIKDYERGVLVGKKTFGKAVVQQWFQLNEDRSVSITISIYKTPNGHWIHKKGIEPDIEVERPNIFENEDDDMLTKLYKGEYIDKLVYDYVEKHGDQDAKEELQALEENVPELMKTLAEDEIELSEDIIKWYIRRTLARVKNIPNIDLENDPQLATAIEEVKKKLMDQG
ncbi:S41 family peptidase [Candidatus Poribacteria bacterium]